VPLARLIDLLPQVIGGQVLVTSRDARWEHEATLAVLDLSTPEEAVRFLLARAGSQDTATAGKVAARLGQLPLALEQAGAYAREAAISLGGYLERLERFPELALARGRRGTVTRPTRSRSPGRLSTANESPQGLPSKLPTLQRVG
jgi:hypothetical protein